MKFRANEWVRASERESGFEHFCGFQIMIFVCGRWPRAATELLRKTTPTSIDSSQCIYANAIRKVQHIVCST